MYIENQLYVQLRKKKANPSLIGHYSSFSSDLWYLVYQQHFELIKQHNILHRGNFHIKTTQTVKFPRSYLRFIEMLGIVKIL